MRSLVLTAAATAALLLAPAEARAQVSLGARLGYGLGLGDVGGTLGMGDWVNGQIPLQLDATYRVNPRLSLGVYLSLGLARFGGDLGDVCDLPGGDCSGRVTRLGVQGSWAFAPLRRAVPWIGAGIGFEWSTVEASGRAGDDDVTYQGWEYLGLQGGVDFAVAPRLSVGPFVLLSLAEYGEGRLSRGGGTAAGQVEDRKLHEWLTLGVRGRFDL